MCVCQVVGVEDARMGEEICACIKLVDGEQSSEEEIKAFCKGQVRVSYEAGFMPHSLLLSVLLHRLVSFQIAHFKTPRYVLFVSSYPLTVTGKVITHKSRQTSVY